MRSSLWPQPNCQAKGYKHTHFVVPDQKYTDFSLGLQFRCQNSLWRVSCSCTNTHNTIQITVLLHLFICCLLCLSVYVISFYSLSFFLQIFCQLQVLLSFLSICVISSRIFLQFMLFLFVCLLVGFFVVVFFVIFGMSSFDCSHNYFILTIFFLFGGGMDFLSQSICLASKIIAFSAYTIYSLLYTSKTEEPPNTLSPSLDSTFPTRIKIKPFPCSADRRCHLLSPLDEEESIKEMLTKATMMLLISRWQSCSPPLQTLSGSQRVLNYQPRPLSPCTQVPTNIWWSS